MYFRETRFAEIGSADEVCGSKAKLKSRGILPAGARVPEPFHSTSLSLPALPGEAGVSGRQLKLQTTELKSSLSRVNY